MPRRTGRKRKRGSDDSWQEIDEISAVAGDGKAAAQVFSCSRLDDPKVLRRKLADNVGDYDVEVIGAVQHTHRFRGAADFYWDMSQSSFAQNYVNQALSADGRMCSSFPSSCLSDFLPVEKLKDFRFTSARDIVPNVDVLPPPIFTHMGLPFNYFYSQNPYVRQTEDGDTINLTAVKQVGYFISGDDPTPKEPQIAADMSDPRMVDAIAQLEEAFQERPVWTRRSLLNRVDGKLKNWNELKKYLNYVAYQFKGGPWRDGVVPYGLDPRGDPKYRIYQTVMFKLSVRARASQGQTWHSLRKAQSGVGGENIRGPVHSGTSDSHVFDGQTYHTDGKVWQLCDITDPLLKEMIDEAAVRPTCDIGSGWYHGGVWAKIKAIMKTKLVAIQFGRHLTRSDFAATLDAGNMTPVRDGQTTFKLPLPNLRLTDAELTALRGYEPPKSSRHVSYGGRTREHTASLTQPPEITPHDERSEVVDTDPAAVRNNVYEEEEDWHSGSGEEQDSDDNDEAGEDYGDEED